MYLVQQGKRKAKVTGTAWAAFGKGLAMKDQLEIVGIGMSVLDVLLRYNRIPTWERSAPLMEFRLAGGGNVATAMVAASRLGARVGFISTEGNDEVADIKRRLLEKEGLDLSRMVVRDEPEDQVVAVYVDAETGEMQFSGLKRYGSIQLRVDELDKDYILSADYLHLDGHHFTAGVQAAQWMKEAGKMVMLDIIRASSGRVADRHLAMLPYVDVLISGAGVGKALTGRDDIYSAGRGVLEMGPRIFVETVGLDGCYTVTANEQFHTPAFPVDVIDTTGAGDVFHGAYLIGLQHRWPLKQIAQFSSAVSALKCTRLGGRDGIPTMTEAIDFLNARGISLPK